MYPSFVTRDSSWCGRGVRADDADELVDQGRRRRDRVMHTLSEALGIFWVVCAGNDALVGQSLPMKAFKIGMIVGQHGTLLGNGIRENCRIANTLASPTSVMDRAHVVSEAAEFLDNRQRKIRPHRAWP